MEELGLGTKATRHTIIQNLITRGYIKGNPLEPYEKAVSVVKMLKKHAERISSPDMTAELEMDMDGIASGEQTQELVVNKSRKMLKQVMARLKDEKEEIAKEIKNGVKEDLKVGKCTQEDCPGDLIIRVSRNKKRFIGCNAYPQCRNTFSLPQKGLILTTKDKCKECGFPVVKIINKGRKPWNLCINPQCPAKDEKYKTYNHSQRAGQTDS
jgi:DNA topoisomerase-1